MELEYVNDGAFSMPRVTGFSAIRSMYPKKGILAMYDAKIRIKGCVFIMHFSVNIAPGSTEPSSLNARINVSNKHD